ncbi:MAG: acetylglutamate kinase [Runella sp.]
MQELLVVKIGGNVIDSPEALTKFLRSFVTLPSPKILVHGGGKIATQVAAKLGVETNMVEGRRITTQPMLEVVTMVYGGLVNKNIVAQLQATGCDAIGLTGADAAVVQAHKRPVVQIDYGLVGDIEKIDAARLELFLKSSLTPVVAPLSFDMKAATLLNTNADTMASAIAVALAEAFSVNLVYCFEKKGVLSDPTDDDSVIPRLTPELYAHHKNEGNIYQGMIPKLDNAFAALQNGVKKVTICHADQLAEALDENQTKGTLLEI